MARDGFEVTARMPPLAEGRREALPWGIVPLSPGTPGEGVLRASYADDEVTGVARDIRVAAAHRSRGLPNTPVGVRVYLGGEGWHVTERPAASRAALDAAGGTISLLPD